MRAAVLLAVALLASPSAWAETVIVSPAEDTYLNINATNYATSPQLNLYTWPVNMIANAILLRWDLTGIPPGAAVQSATIELVMVGLEGPDTTYDATVHRLLRPAIFSRATGRTTDGMTGWTPSACCYQGIPLAQADIAPSESTLVLDRTLGVKRWSVTQMVQMWVTTPAANLGMLVNSDPVAGDGGRVFASMEAADPTQRPRLVVTYTTGSTPPPPPTFLTLTWQDRSDNEDGFRVDRGDNGAALREIARVGANVATWRDETVARGGSYCYEVRAYNAAGLSTPSNRACKGPPGAPGLAIRTEVIP